MAGSPNVIMVSMGFPDLYPEIGIHGGLCRVVGDVTLNLPNSYSVHVFAQSNTGKEVAIRPSNSKGNVLVCGYVPVPNLAGERLGKRLYEPHDSFTDWMFDSQMYALNRSQDYNIAKIIEKSKANGGAFVHGNDWLSRPLIDHAAEQKIPSILQVHLSANRSEDNDFRLVHERACCEDADIIIAVSEETGKDVVKAYGLSSDKVMVIENGVDTEKFRPPRTDSEISQDMAYLEFLGIKKPYAISSGRWVNEKTHDWLLKGFEIFSPNHPEVNLVIAGFAGYTYPKIKGIRDAMDKEVADRIVLIDGLVDVVRLYRQAGMGAYISNKEAFGLVSPETQSCGVPVLVGGVGGLKKTVKSRYSGEFVDPFDVDAVASGLESVYDHREEWGKNARSFALENYSIKDRIPRYLKAYDAARAAI